MPSSLQLFPFITLTANLARHRLIHIQPHLSRHSFCKPFLSSILSHRRSFTMSKPIKQKSPSEQITPEMISEYWANLRSYYYEPGFFSYESMYGTKVRDAAFIKRLLHEAIHAEGTVQSITKGEVEKKRQGDLMQSMIAKGCCELFGKLDFKGKVDFFNILGRDFGVRHEEARKVAEDYVHDLRKDPTSQATFRTEQLLRHTLEPLYTKFFDRVRSLPGGIKFLISMRADLLNLLSQPKFKSELHLKALNESLRDRLSSWLVGFLDLERITWSSPAALLEKIYEYEAVHEVTDMADLKRRVGPGRRVFGFFFRNMPNEPLVFVHVAFTRNISRTIAEILEEVPASTQPDEHTSDAAVFYSITTQRGLAGIDLGAFLIKRVVRNLAQEFPRLKVFCTLSPVPGLRKWIVTEGKKDSKSVLEECEGFPGGWNGFRREVLEPTEGEGDYERYGFLRRNDVKETLMKLCSRYILKEKRGNLALDQVANFHLRNGACAHRLNYLADTSPKGLTESFGLMINYNYILAYIEQNNQRYLVNGTVAVSEEHSENDKEGNWLRRWADEEGVVSRIVPESERLPE